MKDAFRIFDKDGSGFISMLELRYLMTTLGEKLSDDEFDEIMRELNIEQDGKIFYEGSYLDLNSFLNFIYN